MKTLEEGVKEICVGHLVHRDARCYECRIDEQNKDCSKYQMVHYKFVRGVEE